MPQCDSVVFAYLATGGTGSTTTEQCNDSWLFFRPPMRPLLLQQRIHREINARVGDHPNHRRNESAKEREKAFGLDGGGKAMDDASVLRFLAHRQTRLGYLQRIYQHLRQHPRQTAGTQSF